MIKQSFYIIISFVLLGCGNNQAGHEPDRYPTPPDELKKLLVARMADRDFVYDSIYRKYKNRHEEFLLMEIIVDQYNEYSAGLRKAFIRSCGDTTGLSLPARTKDSIFLTNRFFIQTNHSNLFYNEIRSVMEILKPYCSDSLRLTLYNKLDPGNDGKTFSDLYFRDLPPVAAITIINRFDYKVKELEGSILSSLINSK